ncbi:hypothetical protein DSO57_1026608 [Entomophthora muscae]|uniref:Uncharacterized protein n=1 Tax=Entomophthora muscae TaxID=34485 RepID=A0ACC2TPW5_9FUNG|nr:hypothetical protein DSO57_1026608 [Entomophthora muscae]
MDLGFDVRSLSIANISFLGATTCKMLMAPTPAAFFKRKIKELNCPNLRILDNFDAAKAADPKASNALKDTLVNSYTKRIHSVILCDGLSSEVKKFFSFLLEHQSLPLPVVDVPAIVDEIPVSSSQMETDEPIVAPELEKKAVSMKTETSSEQVESFEPVLSTLPEHDSISDAPEALSAAVEIVSTDATANTVSGTKFDELLELALLQSNE